MLVIARYSQCRLLTTVLAIALLLIAAPAPRAQSYSNSAVLALKPRAPLPPFEALDAFGQRFFQRSEYDSARMAPDLEVLDLTYRSDSIPVGGILIRPRRHLDGRWPAIVFNRGGTGDYGRLDNLDVAELLLLATRGFVIVASDYRFVGAASRLDQWGGVDVDDVLHAVTLVRSLPYVDPGRVFMLGLSRGGTMTYLALKRGAPVRAAAVISGVSDLEALGRYRPEFVRSPDDSSGWSTVWPDFATRSADHYRARSAVHWADSIRVPVLILASRADRLVPPQQSLQMALALQAAGKRYALHVYPDDGHGLPRNRADRIRQIVAWFSDPPH